ncbi:MAG: septum formation initiator family protein [Actinomycetota bacterium]|nr:septum formation initiator family protein [Actinomycetota bacterium]
MILSGRATGTLKAALYAALLGVIVASYASPTQSIISDRSNISTLETKVAEIKAQNTAQKRTGEELKTPKGVERAARERYGMVKPGEKIYVVPK